MRLQNKTAIVTGGANGIGSAISKLFAEEGARVIIADIDVENGMHTQNLITEEGKNATFIKTDISKEYQVKNLVKETIGLYNSIDILINDAAAFVWGLVEDVTQNDWRKVFDVNVIGPANCVKHVVPAMKTVGGGSIVNIASVSGFIAQPAFVPYNSSKGALIQLTRCLALDLAPHNIRVNCVCPGAVSTRAAEQHRIFAGLEKKEFDQLAANSSFMKRVGQPIEIAYGALFLASDEASFVTATPLVMDGGATAS